MRPHSAKFVVDEHGTNFFAWSIITDGFFTMPYTKQFIGLPFELEIMLMEGEHGRWASNIANIRKLAVNVLEKIKNNTFNLKEIEKLHKFFGEKVLAQTKTLETRYKNQTPKNFAKTLSNIWMDFAHLNVLGFTIVWSDLEHGLLTKHLEQILLAKKMDAQNLQENLSMLISPTETIAPWEEKKNLLKIATKFNRLKTATESLEFQKHCKNYKWIQYGYQGPELDEKHFKNELGKIYKINPKKQLEKHLNYFKYLKKKQIALKKILKLSTEEIRMFETAKKIMYLKAYRVDIRHFFHWKMDKIFKNLGHKYHLPMTWFHYAEREEILKLVETGKTDTRQGLSRSKFLLRVTEKGKIKFIPKNKADTFLKKALLEEKIIISSKISGATAFPGIAKGKVKIVLSRNDIAKVNKGDVLVATATNPDLLPAMYKASAFVTDSGGITSHAAIVAREMKKPCIIGTKIATKIFKDGDLVEVNANIGMVKLIKKD